MLRLVLAAALLSLAVPTVEAAECDPGFSSLIPRIVRKEAVAAVDSTYEIRFWQFCKGKDFHDLGNTAGLTRTIAANPRLAGPIEAKDWSVDDVKFIRIEGRIVDLWLHRDP